MRWTSMASILAVMALAAPALADTPMFDFPPPPFADAAASGTDGFRFRPNVDIEVTALGYYDHDQDGFGTGFHPVAIFDFATRAQLTKVSVLNASPVDGLFRYAEIEPLTLTAGVSYMLAGYTPGMEGNHALGPTGLTTASAITYEGYRYIENTGDVIFPTQSDNTPFFGPNLRFRALAAPTPGDTNGDGLVDLEDLNNVRNHFGESGTPVIGDTSPFDGVVDLDDLNAVRNHFGTGPGVAAPEPSAGTLAAAFVVPALLVRFRRRETS